MTFSGLSARRNVARNVRKSDDWLGRQLMQYNSTCTRIAKSVTHSRAAGICAAMTDCGPVDRLTWWKEIWHVPESWPGGQHWWVLRWLNHTLIPLNPLCPYCSALCSFCSHTLKLGLKFRNIRLKILLHESGRFFVEVIPHQNGRTTLKTPKKDLFPLLSNNTSYFIKKLHTCMRFNWAMINTTF